MQSYPFTSILTYDKDGNPIYDRAVTAEFLRNFYKKDRSNGVIALDDSSSFLVVASDGMTVNVYPGYAFINGAYAYEQKNRKLEITASDTLDRIDSIILRLDDARDARGIDLYVKSGNPGSNPVPPTLTREGDVYEIGIANIFIPANSTAITDERITDTRLNTERCGYSIPMQEIDTTSLFNQLQDQINANIELIQRAIDETEAAYLQAQIDDIQELSNEDIDEIIEGQS